MRPQYQSDATRSPSVAVVEAVAEAHDLDSTELETPLGDVIDPEALDSLFTPTQRASSNDEKTVTFRYGGYTVTVDSEATVTLVE